MQHYPVLSKSRRVEKALRYFYLRHLIRGAVDTPSPFIEVLKVKPHSTFTGGIESVQWRLNSEACDFNGLNGLAFCLGIRLTLKSFQKTVSHLLNAFARAHLLSWTGKNYLHRVLPSSLLLVGINISKEQNNSHHFQGSVCRSFLRLHPLRAIISNWREPLMPSS